MKDFAICLGTVGEGVWHSSDSGASWHLSEMNLPFAALPGEISIRALRPYPDDPGRILAGSEMGLYRSEDSGATWQLVESIIEDYDQIWSVGVNPVHPEQLLVGTKPPAVYSSTDAGATWERLRVPFPESSFIGANKVTNVLFDPREGREDWRWAGVEVGGLYLSTDQGRTWRALPPLGEDGDLLSQDVHGMAITTGDPSKVLVSSPTGIWSSESDGASWSSYDFPRFFEGDRISYCRGVAVKEDDPDVIVVANGDMIPGVTGAIQRSTDGGATWKAARLSSEPNSTVYGFGTHPADPDVMVAHTLNGYVYVSTDAGESWERSRREFGEIRSIAWLPN